MAIAREHNIVLGQHINDKGILCNRVLKISTRKGQSGGLFSTATVASREQGTPWETFAIYQDFYLRLAHVAMRATQKNIDTLHDQSMALIDQIKSNAMSHYHDWIKEEANV